MGMDDLVMEVQLAARSVLMKTGALEVCEFHPQVTIRVGDPDAEKHAYARATTILKSDGEMFLREELMPAIKDELDMAADGECPECERERDK